MRSVFPRAALVTVVAALASCGNPAGRSALDVTVTIAPGAQSACVIVEAGDQRTDPLPVAGKTTLRVGVVRTDRMPATIPVIALGYSDAACQTRIVPTEQSDTLDVTFEANAITQVALTVGPVVGPTDLDGDGSAVPQDCDDNNPAIHPGAVEICTNKIDDNCNGLTDCADPSCDTQACATGAICGGGACREQMCADGLDNDGNEGTDCQDPDCNGRPCLNGGTCTGGSCQGASSEVGLCADGQDNDNDGLTDCADPDCAGQACSDGTFCTSGKSCQSGLCAGGTAVMCPVTGPVCTVSSTGVCQAGDGGCRFSAQPADAGCDDGNLCTVSDRCDGDGGCTGQPLICATPPGACYQPTGVCQPADGGCRYDARPAGGTCDDGNNCTLLDTCDGDGGCKGTPQSCTPAQCQSFSGACTDAGTCVFVPTPGAACDGGTCNAQSSCVLAATWPYAPSNFTIGQLTNPSAAVVINCTTAAIRTRLASPEAVFEGWCGGAVVPTFSLGSSTATAPVIVSMLGLTVASGAALRVYGERPVILAVQGNVQIDGLIDVGALVWENGAGGDKDCPASARPSTGTCNGNACGGGGGAGYGAAGRDAGDAESSGGPGGVYGQAFGNQELIPLVGGCAGAPGGAVAPVNRADAGGGGGALQLSASGTVAITDRISAAGGGGSGGLVASSRSGGGGGAGSGGALLIEAQSFSMGGSAWLACNGGGGGEGSDNNNGSPGAVGQDGRANSTTSATGGTGGANNGGNGGQGGTSVNAPGNGLVGTSGSEHGGGGGGGAGMGRVRLNVIGTCSRGGGTITASFSAKTIDGGSCP